MSVILCAPIGRVFPRNDNLVERKVFVILGFFETKIKQKSRIYIRNITNKE